MLQLPPTIRFPLPEDVPVNSYSDIFNKIKNAKIEQGYTMTGNPNADLPFDFFAEINIDNSRLWDLFLILMDNLPEEVYCVYNICEDEPIFSPYRKKKDVVKVIEGFKTEITMDGWLDFGVAFHNDNILNEVFITHSKYIKYWGKDRETFKEKMLAFDLQEISDLNFIDEFPRVTETLLKFDSSARDTYDVIASFNALLA